MLRISALFTALLLIGVGGACSSNGTGPSDQSNPDGGAQSPSNGDGGVGASSSSGGSGSGSGSTGSSSGTSSGSGSGSGAGSGSSSGTAPPSGFDAGPITGLTGKTYYVSPTGSDSNPGSSSAPWLTIQQAGLSLAPGDTLIVMAGTYAGVIFGWDSAGSGETDQALVGTATNPILIEADPSAAAGSVIIDSKNSHTAIGFDLEPGSNYVDIRGFTLTNPGGSITKAGIAVNGCTGNRVLGNTVNGVSGIGGILVDTATDVIVQGNTVESTKGSGDTGHGMYISGSSVGVQVLDNLVHDNDYVGIHVNGDVSEGLPGVVKGALIAGNLIYKNGQNGINADGLESSTITNNVIYGNANNGIELYQIDAFGGSTGNLIVNNTVDATAGDVAIEVTACAYDNQSSQPTPAGCSTGADDTSTGNIAFDNVLLGKSQAISDVSSADVLTSTNITTATTGLFVDSASGNYALTAGGPGIGKGIATFSGASAPAAGSGSYDIGAFAFVQP